MSLDSIQIPAPGLSLGADIYRTFRLGEISSADYLAMSAKLVADTAHEERPKLYPPLLPPVWQYVSNRLYGGAHRDDTSSLKLGNWIIDSFRALDHNIYLIGHFGWAKGKLTGPAFEGERKALDAAVDRFEALRFQSDEYLKGRKVQEMDSIDRQKGRA